MDEWLARELELEAQLSALWDRNQADPCCRNPKRLVGTRLGRNEKRRNGHLCGKALSMGWEPTPSSQLPGDCKGSVCPWDIEGRQ